MFNDPLENARGSDPDGRPSCRLGPIASAFKRGLDIALAAIGLLFALPVIAVAAAAIYLTMGRPIVFTQVRAGYHGRPFRLFKLRSMQEALMPDGKPLPDSNRLTRLGRLLRRTSIDELPQLINVIRGEMSLVGPRPLLPEYLPLYTADQARRHKVRPGLTGWSQVRGRNAARWEERLRDDVWYVDHQSIFLDLKILALTPLCALAGTGICAAGEATMPRFVGTSSTGAVR